MAGSAPFFLTGANAKILLNNKTMAFATDLSYKITVKHASPRVLGRYEVEVHQPLSYDVTGSFTIIRYARGLKSYQNNNTPDSIDEAGNGIGSFGDQTYGGSVGSAFGLPTSEGQFDGKANEAFNPSRMFQSKMFDIEIRQKVSYGANRQTEFANVGQALVGALLGTNTTGDNETTVVLLRDCRIEMADFKITKKGAATQTFTFKARYADDDTYIAKQSGVGQELS